MGLDAPAIVQTNDTAGRGLTKNESGDSLSRPVPIVAYHGPHDAEQAEPLLNRANSVPALPIWRSQKGGRGAELPADDVLRLRDFSIDKGGRFEIEVRMGVGVVADFMTGGEDGARDGGITLHVHAALKERRANVLGRQVVDEERREAPRSARRDAETRSGPRLPPAFLSTAYEPPVHAAR